MNNYDDLFNRNTNSESLQNKRTEKNIAALEDIFKGSVNFEEDTISLGNNSNEYSSNKSDNTNAFGFPDIQKNESSVDLLEKTRDINIDLETLRNYSKILHEAQDGYGESNISQEESIDNTQGSSQTKGKQKVLSTKPVNKYSSSEDMSQILSAFISCSILSFITAGMGVGWLLYIIMHI